MITFERVSKRYDGGHDALRELSLQIDADELVFLTGHSGAGKSTLMRLITLIERPSRGQVIVNGRDLSRVRRGGIAAHRRDIGVVFQNHQLLNDRPVFDNVALPLIIGGFDHREVGRRVRAALDKVGLLSRERAMPITLSGGEQQRVGIARAVVNRPPVLLADEPTGNLDPELSAEIMQLFQAFNQVGVTVLIASHDLALISRLRHRIITLKEGRLVTAGGAMAQPDSPQPRVQPRRDGASQSRTRLQDRYRAWIRHHRLSAADSLHRLLHSPWASILTWLVIGVALALPVGLSVALDNARQLGDNLDSPVQLSLFLESEVSLEEARQLELQLASLEQVASTALVSSDDALAEFQQMSGFGDVLQSLETNPLPHLLLAAPVEDIDPAAAGELRVRLEAMPEVERAVLDMEWLQRLNGLMVLWQRLVLAIAALLVLGVLLVLGNSIRLAIENRRDEIVIVKLVGGTNAFVRRPFLYTGLWYGIGGGVVAALAVTLALAWLSGPINNLAALYSSEFQLRGLGIFGAGQLVLSGGFLGLLGSAVAVSRHLGEIEPR